MAFVHLPDWATNPLEAAGVRPGDDISGLLADCLNREVSRRLDAAARRLASELVLREKLLAQRGQLEEEQTGLLHAIGRQGAAETNLRQRNMTAYRWNAFPLPDDEALFRAIVLLEVTGRDDLEATMQTNSRRASVHFSCFELAHDNQVIGFHNAALRSQAGARNAAPKTARREGETT